MVPEKSALVNLLIRLHEVMVASTFSGDVDLFVVVSKDRFMNAVDFIARQNAWDKDKRRRLRKLDQYNFSDLVTLEWDADEAYAHAELSSALEKMKER